MTRKNRSLALGSLVVLASAVLCGCSSFNHAWQLAGTQPPPTNSITGRWEGQWLSQANGHHGALRCVITPGTNGLYDAHFRATYKQVLRFSYVVPLHVTASNGVWHFTGEEDLGALAGGVYRYTGTASQTHFNSTYRSPHDVGVFQMERPR